MDANEARGEPDSDEQRTITEAEPTARGKGDNDIRTSEMAPDSVTESVVTYLPDRSPSSPALDKKQSHLAGRRLHIFPARSSIRVLVQVQ